MIQSSLLKELQKELPKNISLIEAVATALEISYDAAHRRTSLKSKFSLEESVVLAKYYNISLDKLFDNISKDYVVIEKTKNITTEEDLKVYFEESYNSLHPLLKQKESRILYSAKDIPIFYTLAGDVLSRFKMYVWLKLVNPSFLNKHFNSFTPNLSLVTASKKLGNIYQDLNITEIWDITTINSTLKQIHYYFQASQISIETALELCKNLHQIISKVSSHVTSTENQFLLYYNELHLMNNNVLVSTPTSQSLYVPFTLLSYYKTSDKHTCKEAEQFLKRQLQGSKLLNTAGEKEQAKFFNKMYQKITALEQLINASNLLDFE